jgi:hypothetical protein
MLVHGTHKVEEQMQQENTSGQEPKILVNSISNINFNAVVDFTNNYNISPNETNSHTSQQYLEGSGVVLL